MLLSGSFLLFLAVMLPLYFAVPRRLQPTVLLVGSVAFYAFAGWRPLCVLLLLTVITYAVGCCMGGMLARQGATLAQHREDGSWDKPTRRAYRDAGMRRVRAVLALGVTADVALLLVCKLALPERVGLAGWTLPIGLSFVTLSAVSYLCDVARGQIESERRLGRMMLFLFYFPQIWQGPISRYGELVPQLTAPHAPDAERLLSGTLRALWGGVKKLVFADTAALATAAILERQTALGGTGMILLTLLYSLQIYADFTGGIDVCLGISSAMGVDLYENFDRPFGSPSVAEYWRRWHRSLGRFFTDYVFYPLSVGRGAQRLSQRGGVARQLPLYAALLLTWGLTGLWHGVSTNFLVWGMCNGVFILLSQLLRPLRSRLGARLPRVAASRVWRGVLCCGTFLTVGLFRTLDLNPRAAVTLSLWREMLRPSAWLGLGDGVLWQALGLRAAEWGLLAVGVVLMWAVSRRTPRLGERAPALRVRLAARPLLCGALCAVAVTAMLVLGRYGMDYHATDFIYGRF